MDIPLPLWCGLAVTALLRACASKLEIKLNNCQVSVLSRSDGAIALQISEKKKIHIHKGSVNAKFIKDRDDAYGE